MASRDSGRGENLFLLGTKEGLCPLCGRGGELLVLRDGVTACMECLNDLVQILELGQGRIRRGELRRLLVR